MSSPFETYKFLLKRLHQMQAQDPDEKDEIIQQKCEEIRDCMDGPWHQLTEEEKQMVRKLSGDLYLKEEGERK